jgi:hypothetical protein
MSVQIGLFVNKLRNPHHLQTTNRHYGSVMIYRIRDEMYMYSIITYAFLRQCSATFVYLMIPHVY